MDEQEVKELEKSLDGMSEMEFRKALFKEIVCINHKVDPMYEIFTSVSGFGRITTMAFKIVLGIAAFIGAMIAIFKFIVNNGE